MKLILLLLAFCFSAQAQDSYVDARVSNTEGVSTSAVSATGNISAAKFVGDGSLLTGLGTASPSWYVIQNIPQAVQDVSTGVNVSVTTINGQYASFTALAVAGQNITATPSWYSLANVPAQVQQVSSSGNVSLTNLSVSATTALGTVTAAQVTASNISATNLSIGGTGSRCIFAGSGGVFSVNTDFQCIAGSARRSSMLVNVASIGISGGGLEVSGTVSATQYSGSNAIFHSCTFSLSPTTAIIKGNNCGSINRFGVGNAGVSFTTVAADTSYTVVCTAMRLTTSVYVTLDNSFPPNTGGYVLRVLDDTNTFRDSGRVSCMAIQ